MDHAPVCRFDEPGDGEERSVLLQQTGARRKPAMNAPIFSSDVYPTQWLRPTVDFLLSAQRASGEIPWFEGGHTDPWDHTEAAMALSIAGETEAATRA